MMGYQPRHSNFGTNSVQSSRGPTPRPSSFEENGASSPRFGFYPTQTELMSSNATPEIHPKATGVAVSSVGKLMPPTSVMTRLILFMISRKLIRNPNIYSFDLYGLFLHLGGVFICLK
ncbi:unnamed protein product [Lathyrus oleraceus]